VLKRKRSCGLCLEPTGAQVNKHFPSTNKNMTYLVVNNDWGSEWKEVTESELLKLMSKSGVPNPQFVLHQVQLKGRAQLQTMCIEKA
jgi:hypothetical protein